MSDHEKIYPDNWQIKDYNPNDHMMDLKGRDYLNVQNRLLWFIRDQRALIVRGLAQVPYVIRTELVELDREKGYALFMTYIRDVLGNETTAYGSETAKDFGDYAEKAGTKSEGRALLNMGYGTAAAPEMDEGERVVDTPVERKRPAPAQQQQQQQTHTEKKLETLADVQQALANYRNVLHITDKDIIVTDEKLDYQASLARRSEYVEAWKRASVERQRQGVAR